MVLLVLVFVLGGWCWCFDFLELVVWSLMAFQVEDFALGASWPAFQGALCCHSSDCAMLRTLGFLAWVLVLVLVAALACPGKPRAS